MYRISLIIPNFNGKKLLQRNLPQVFKAVEVWKGEWEIIVVDDASEDDSVAFLRKNYPKVKIISHKENQRFAISCNDGAEAARGEILVFLNNDVTPEADFLRPLLDNFHDKEVFAVGCREKSEKKGKTIFSGRALGKFSRGFLVHRRAQDQTKKDTLWVATGSAAYRKSLWQKLGGLDSLYQPAYMEDVDLSYRALKSGYKLVFEPKSVVFHQHETTNIKALGEKGIKLAAFKNQFIFVWKNITDRSYLFSHLLWLPYHLFVSTIRSNGLFLLGFLQAITQLPAVLSSRSLVKKEFKFSDKEILENYA